MGAKPQVDFGWPPVAFVDVSGLRMAYREWGRAGAARTVVLIHGGTSSSLSWVRVAPVLARRHRVLAVDLKGHGDSGRTPDGYRIADQAREVEAFCIALGIRGAAVVGHSWGGAIALQLPSATDLVGRLVLEDPAISARNPDTEEWARAEESLAGWMGLSRAEAERRAIAYLAQGWTAEDVASKVEAATSGSPEAVRSIFAELRKWNGHDLVRTLRCPTLLLHAAPERGGVVDAESLALARANPRVRAVLVPEADHNIHRGRFDDFMAAVDPFLAGEDS